MNNLPDLDLFYFYFLTDNPKLSEVIADIQKTSNGTHKVQFFSNICDYFIKKKDARFMNYFLKELNMTWYLGHQVFPFIKMLSHSPELLNSSEQLKIYGANPWIEQIKHFCSIKFPEKDYHLESIAYINNIKLMLEKGNFYKKQILDSWLSDAIFSPEIKLIQFLEQHIDLNNLENQKILFKGYQPYTDKNTKLAKDSQKGSQQYHREQLFLEVFDYFLQKMPLLQIQNKSSKQLLKQLYTDKRCVDNWVMTFENHLLKEKIIPVPSYPTKKI